MKKNIKEIINKTAKNKYNNETLSWENEYAQNAFIDGAEFVQRISYSEEEVKIILFAREFHYEYSSPNEFLFIDEWFKQFEKNTIRNIKNM
jgi:sulfur relay (sulfurtransferase) DsrC/TusE family protein